MNCDVIELRRQINKSVIGLWYCVPISRLIQVNFILQQSLHFYLHHHKFRSNQANCANTWYELVPQYMSVLKWTCLHLNLYQLNNRPNIVDCFSFQIFPVTSYLIVGSVFHFQCMFPFVLFHMFSRDLFVASFWNLIYYVNIVVKTIVFLCLLTLVFAMLLHLSFSLFFLGITFFCALLFPRVFIGILPTIR